MNNQQNHSKSETFATTGAMFIERQRAIQGGGHRPWAIKPGEAEWLAWERYFRGFLDWTPAVLRMVEIGTVPSMTVPCQWPEWFDDRFDAARFPPRERPVDEPAKPVSKERVAALMRQLGWAP